MNHNASLKNTTDFPRLLTTLACWAYVLVFLYAAFYKLFDFGYFLRQLEHSPLLKGYRYLVAWLVPLSEIAISLLLLFPGTRLKGLYAAVLLMGCFTAYIVYILNFSPHVPCSCGGILATMDWGEHLVFNCCLIALGALGIVLQKKIKVK